jgi:hypothetical protein
MISVILALTTNAFAEWVEVDSSENRGFSMFLDPSSIKKFEEIHKVMILKNYKEPQKSVEGEASKKILSAVSTQEINCSKNIYRSIKIERWSGLNGTGRLEFSYDYKNKNDWSKWVKSSSLEGAVISRVCRST